VQHFQGFSFSGQCTEKSTQYCFVIVIGLFLVQGILVNSIRNHIVIHRDSDPHCDQQRSGFNNCVSVHMSGFPQKSTELPIYTVINKDLDSHWDQHRSKIRRGSTLIQIPNKISTDPSNRTSRTFVLSHGGQGRSRFPQ
jgi:hypothetical protein